MRIERQQHVESAESWTDHEVLQRMRRDDPAAIREFYRRFVPVLWKEARRAHVQPALRDDIAIDCLGDSAIHLMQATVAVPANLTGYLVAAFRHRLANDRRATQRRLAAGTAAVSYGSYGFGERVVREVCSEASLRASAGPAAETAPLSPVLERLSRVIDAGITEQERQILRWISAGIPQRLIGEWLGITHNAARVRVLRLRDRLIEVALRYDGPWHPGERDELYAFFRRCGLSERALEAAQAREKGIATGAPERSRPRAGRKPPQEDQ
jgi:DNA-directed RNA polymerase specialized sigma24 family protein